MAPNHAATTNRPWPAGAVRSAASISAVRLAFAAMALGAGTAVAHADNARGEPRQADANVHRAAQTLPPARVILPAPWEQATPVKPAAPAEPSGRR